MVIIRKLKDWNYKLGRKKKRAWAWKSNKFYQEYFDLKHKKLADIKQQKKVFEYFYKRLICVFHDLDENKKLWFENDMDKLKKELFGDEDDGGN